MDLKILSFNKVLFKKDFNIVKLLILFIAGVIFATTTGNILSAGNSFNKLEKSYIEHEVEYNREDLIKQYKNRANWLLDNLQSNGISLIIILVMPITLIAILFGEEKRRKTFEVLKVMPYTKYEIFFNKLLVSLASISLPFILNGLIMILALVFSPTLRMFYSVGQIIRWVLLLPYYQLPILAFALLFGTLTANTFSHIILTIIFLVFPIGFPTLIFWNLGNLGFGSRNRFFGDIFQDILTKIIKYTPIGALINQGDRNYLLYILGSLIIFIISKMLFEKNKIERNGETLEFENTEGFFKFGVSLCTGLLMGVVFHWIFTDYIYLSRGATVLVMFLGYIVGGILGYLAARFSIKTGRSKG